MITKHSVDLYKVHDPCFALTYNGNCLILRMAQNGCCSVKCPFYKPINCKDWIRIEDRTGINLIPPEEAYGKERR